MRYLILSVFFLFNWLFVTSVFGQRFKREYKYVSVGWNINAMNYVGELDPGSGNFSPGIKFTRENIGLSVSKRVSPRISLRANVSHGTIEGNDYENASWSKNDIYRKIRNLSFKNSIWEVKTDAMMDILQHRGNPLKRLDYTPYLFVGIAYFHHNPKAKTPESMGGNWVSLQPLKLEGVHYSLHQIAIPFGMGFRYKPGKKSDISFEIGWRITFTDYLDDVSSSYQGNEHFEGNQLAIAMNDRSMEGISADAQLEGRVNELLGYNSSGGYTTPNGFGRANDQRGDPKRKDWYMVTGIHYTYLIYPKVIKCPPKFR